ncbi:MAG: hypothetical protein WBE76_16155 [Terracidiphilus sp.]
MSKRICASLVLLLAMRAWSQMAQGGAAGIDTQMQLPPMVSGDAYPTEVGSEARSNYLSGGIGFQTAYYDNAYGGTSAGPVSDVSYSINPSINLSQTTPRQRRTFSYSPGFIFFEPTSELNTINQSATGAYQYRMTPHLTIGANESFNKTSSIFSQNNGTLDSPVPGAQQPLGVVAPFANMISNVTSGQMSYQFRLNSMIGGAGSYSKQSYGNQSQAAGLSNSSAGSALLFYSQRLGNSQYFGFRYQYARSLDILPAFGQSTTETQAFTPFYAIFFTRTLSLSLSGGPQYVNSVEPAPYGSFVSWVPTASAAIGWQGTRASFSTGYSRSVWELPGLFGAQESTNLNANARWLMSRTWSVGANANYQTQKSAGPVAPIGSQSGHTVSGSVFTGHAISEHLQLSFGYNRMHQSYSGIATIANNPNSDQAYVSLSYRFTRPLGR